MSAATETCTPYNGGPNQPDADWSDERFAFYGSGVLNRTARDVAGVSQRLAVFTNEDGRQVKVSPGQAEIHGKFYRNTGVVAVKIAPNTSGQTRVDRIVVRSNEVTKQCGVQAIPGTPGDSNPPPLSWGAGGIYDVPLAVVAVLSGFNTIESGSISQLYGMWANQDSGWIDYSSNVTLSSNYQGTSTPGPTPFIQNNDFYCRYRIIGNTCDFVFHGLIRLEGTASWPSYNIGLPIAARNSNLVVGAASLQNTVGCVYTWPGDSPSTTNAKMFGIIKYDHSGLTLDANTYDSFSASYECDPSALPS